VVDALSRALFRPLTRQEPRPLLPVLALCDRVGDGRGDQQRPWV